MYEETFQNSTHELNLKIKKDVRVYSLFTLALKATNITAMMNNYSNDFLGSRGMKATTMSDSFESQNII